MSARPCQQPTQVTRRQLLGCLQPQSPFLGEASRAGHSRVGVQCYFHFCFTKTKINLYSAWLLSFPPLLSTQEYILTGVCGAELKAPGQEHCEVKSSLRCHRPCSAEPCGCGPALPLAAEGAESGSRAVSGSSISGPGHHCPPFSHSEDCRS